MQAAVTKTTLNRRDNAPPDTAAFGRSSVRLEKKKERQQQQRLTYRLGVDDVRLSLDAVEHLQGRQQAPPRARLPAARWTDHHDAVPELQHLKNKVRVRVRVRVRVWVRA